MFSPVVNSRWWIYCAAFLRLSTAATSLSMFASLVGSLLLSQPAIFAWSATSFMSWPTSKSFLRRWVEISRSASDFVTSSGCAFAMLLNLSPHENRMPNFALRFWHFSQSPSETLMGRGAAFLLLPHVRLQKHNFCCLANAPCKENPHVWLVPRGWVFPCCLTCVCDGCAYESRTRSLLWWSLVIETKRVV